jgi:hypothetical protein
MDFMIMMKVMIRKNTSYIELKAQTTSCKAYSTNKLSITHLGTKILKSQIKLSASSVLWSESFVKRVHIGFFTKI